MNMIFGNDTNFNNSPLNNRKKNDLILPEIIIQSGFKL